MDFQYVLLVIFIALMLGFLWIKRKNIEVQGLFPFLYFVMYRTRLGLRAMERLARIPGLTGVLVFGVLAGFAGMLFISYHLVRNSFLLFTEPGTVSGIQPVLPFEAKGVFFVPFVYWILSIFVIAVVHEFSHGIAARKFGLPVNSSGLAFLGVLVPLVPAAFVEPDERKLQKDKAWRQLCVFAAGPASNLVMAGLVMLVIVVAANPLAEAMLAPAGVRVAGVVEGSPAEQAGIAKDALITGIDGARVERVRDLTGILEKKSPGESVVITTHAGDLTLELGKNPASELRAYLGIQSRQHADVRESFPLPVIAPFIVWAFGLLYWLFLLSLGIGLFNLLPIGPIDGGRMLQVAAQSIFSEKSGTKVWKVISMVFLFLVITNVIAGFIV